MNSTPIRFRNRAWILLCAAFLAAEPALAQHSIDEAVDHCGCRCPCFKPWSPPDRWDDQTVIAGHESWANNGLWDSEPFTDWNADDLWQPGEPFEDRNGDGRFNSEFYHPILTGYTRSRDQGRPIVVRAGSWHATGLPGFHFAVSLPDDDRRAGGVHAYVADILDCHVERLGPGDRMSILRGTFDEPTRRAVNHLVARDPDARVNDAGEVVDSRFEVSPRTFLLAFHDPRTDYRPGGRGLVITKLAGFFLEGWSENGEVTAQFIEIRAGGNCASGLRVFEGEALPEGFEPSPVSSVRADLEGTSIPHPTWGRIKVHWR